MVSDTGKLIRYGFVASALVSGAMFAAMVPDTRSGLAWAQDLTFSAKVDKTTVDIGSPLTLTITLSGDLSDAQLPPLEFPEGFSKAARSQSTNFSIRAGAAERSTSLVYVLVPQQAGTFQLGPFRLTHHGKDVQTETIQITVNKPAVPPHLQEGERFTL